MLKFYINLFAILLFSYAKLNAQNIYTLAGTGAIGSTGDGGFSTLARLNQPQGIETDNFGNIYICDRVNNRIRKINSSGIITTIAGGVGAGFSGDGGLATLAKMNHPNEINIDKFGNIYFSDNNNNRIRKIDVSGIITTVAGNGIAGFSGDGGLAINAQIASPTGVTTDKIGNLYFADKANVRIRRIDLSGIITTIAGSGSIGYSGDGGPATAAKLASPSCIQADSLNNIYFTDGPYGVVRKINSTGTISTFAGNGIPGFSGDGGQANLAQLNYPWGITLDTAGNVFIADQNLRVRKINKFGVITTIAGSGSSTYSGDGGPAILAGFTQLYGIEVDNSGNIFVSDPGNNRVRAICTTTCSMITNINPNEKLKVKELLYPNPNSGLFNLSIIEINQKVELVIVNSIGQVVHKQDIQSSTTNIETKDLSKGLYSFLILKSGVISTSGKFLIE